MTSRGAPEVDGRVPPVADVGVGGRIRKVCTGDVTDPVVTTACLPAKRTGLPGNRALAVVVAIPDIAPAVTGILSRMMLDDEDVGTEIEVAGFCGAVARGLESSAPVEVLAEVGDRMTYQLQRCR